MQLCTTTLRDWLVKRNDEISRSGEFKAKELFQLEFKTVLSSISCILYCRYSSIYEIAIRMKRCLTSLPLQYVGSLFAKRYQNTFVRSLQQCCEFFLFSVNVITIIDRPKTTPHLSGSDEYLHFLVFPISSVPFLFLYI